MVTPFSSDFNLCERWPEHAKDKDPLDPLGLIEDSPVAITNYYICFVLLCMYVLTVNIMLINLLIAIFSNTYSDSKAKSGLLLPQIMFFTVKLVARLSKYRLGPLSLDKHHCMIHSMIIQMVRVHTILTKVSFAQTKPRIHTQYNY